MQIDLKTVSIEPQRVAYDHLIRRFGNKPASRYQEGSYDIQASENLHYRPTWDPDHELYDASMTKIVMEDWYAIRDTRQFFYQTYVLTRARQQDANEFNFAFVESKNLLDSLDPEVRQLAADVLVPLRHAAYGANLNNSFVCGYGYGTTFTQPCMYHAMDNLAIGQYLSRLGLMLGGTDALAKGKADWTEAEVWQELRRLVEDIMAVRDPVEVFVAQNVCLDGLLYPLLYERFTDKQLSSPAVAMLTQFQSQWFEEGRKWIDGVLKAMAAESEANASQLAEWVTTWTDRAEAALAPVAQLALGDQATEAMATDRDTLAARMKKAGVEVAARAEAK